MLFHLFQTHETSRVQKNRVKGTYLLVPRCDEGPRTAPLAAASLRADAAPSRLGSSGGLGQVADAIVAPGPVLAGLKEARVSIPVVMAGAGSDPVQSGFVSLAHTGGNFTG